VTAPREAPGEKPERVEQLAWMIDSENRVANSSIPRSIQE